MAKSLWQDVPRELKNWCQLFEKLTYRYDYSRVFGDWLEICICCFAFQTMEERYFELIKPYSKEEITLMSQMMGEYILIMEEKLRVIPDVDIDGFKKEDYPNAVPWYDALGAIYETISSRGKKSGLGQFFTPESVVKFMVKVLDPQSEEAMCEPASGSGRFVIAAHCHSPGSGIKIAIDTDPMCVNMTALNMFMHGVRGEAICANSLDPTDFRFGYIINPRIIQPGVYKLKKENSWYWRGNMAWLSGASEKDIAEKQTGNEALLISKGVDVSKLEKPSAEEIKRRYAQLQLDMLITT